MTKLYLKFHSISIAFSPVKQTKVYVNVMYIISMNVRNKDTCLNLRKVEA